MKRWTCIMLCCILVFSTGGCGRTPAPPDEETEVLEALLPLEELPGKREWELTREDFSPPAPIEWGEEQSGAVADFSAQIFQLVVSSGEENPVISPMSAYLALAMAAQGADTQTQEAFQKVLGLGGDELVRSCYQLVQRLENLNGGTKLHLANSLWCSADLAVKEPFLQTAAGAFGAQIFSVDMADAQTVNRVNLWVREQTNQRIPKLVEELPENTRMALLNCLYLDAVWMHTFDSNYTREREFKLADGSTVSVPFLVSDLQPRTYFRGEETEGVVLPYQDGELAFVAIKPTEGIALEEIKFDSGSLQSLIAQAAPRQEVALSMPKFDLEYAVSLNEILCEMGLKSAFDPQQADFGQIAAEDLYLDEVYQKVRIRVDEEGTEAAAASGVLAAAASEPESEPLYLTYDVPYYYAVVELESCLPLFLGKMDNPAKSVS